MIKSKREHGKFYLCDKLGLEENPPIQCDFKIGDKVIYTNDYGVKFNMEVIGFSETINDYGQFIHLAYSQTDYSGCAWRAWPVKGKVSE